MHVGRVMQTNLVTVPPDTSLLKAQKLIDEKKIAHLLVVDRNKKLLGMVSDRDLKRSWASSATTLSKHELNYLLNQLTLEVIMAKRVIAVSPGTTIERAAHFMQENRISALPVMDQNELVGIITTTDVMRVLLQAIGLDKDSARFSVLVQDRKGVIADISKLLDSNQINIRSLVTWPDQDYPGVYQLVLRVAAKDGERAIEALTAGGFKVLTDYLEDLSPYLT